MRDDAIEGSIRRIDGQQALGQRNQVGAGPRGASMSHIVEGDHAVTGFAEWGDEPAELSGPAVPTMNEEHAAALLTPCRPHPGGETSTVELEATRGRVDERIGLARLRGEPARLEEELGRGADREAGGDASEAPKGGLRRRDSKRTNGRAFFR